MLRPPANWGTESCWSKRGSPLVAFLAFCLGCCCGHHGHTRGHSHTHVHKHLSSTKGPPKSVVLQWLERVLPWRAAFRRNVLWWNPVCQFPLVASYQYYTTLHRPCSTRPLQVISTQLLPCMYVEKRNLTYLVDLFCICLVPSLLNFAK